MINESITGRIDTQLTVKELAMDDLMTPDKIAEKGERIYDDFYRAKYEGYQDGHFLAIDTTNEAAYLGDYPEEALDKAVQENSNGRFYLVKIGAETAFHVGYIGVQNSDLGWPFRHTA